jgi:pantoate--beta-alanine ligase
LKTVSRIADLPADRKGVVGFVPTMGAFHEGHLSLMRTARAECDTVIVSLFVNPTQFGPNEDYAKYPRNEEADAAMAAGAGVDVLFVPTVEEMYPGNATTVRVEGVTSRWEGAHRPTHFDGVTTVVCKLLNIVRPDVAFFGLKDFQQCAVVQTMVKDLNMPVRIRLCETLRESSGLAMSSRNQYLSANERETAPELYRGLRRTAESLRACAPCDAAGVDEQLTRCVENLTDSGFRVDYLALVDCHTLEPLDRLVDEARMIVAAKLGSVRLIDNVAV